MAIAFVQQAPDKANASSSTTFFNVLPANATPGNTVVAMVPRFNSGASVTGVTGVGGTFVNVGSANNPTSGTYVSIWVATNVTGGSATVTANLSGSTASTNLMAIEFSGVQTTSPLDVTATNTHSGAGADSLASLTPTAFGDLFLGLWADGTGAYTVAAPTNSYVDGGKDTSRFGRSAYFISSDSLAHSSAMTSSGGASFNIAVSLFAATATTTPTISSWSRAVNQPTRTRIAKRQLPLLMALPPIQGSQAPYLTYWVNPICQPLKNRVPKRQQPNSYKLVFPALPSQPPYLSYWKQSISQPLRSRQLKRQQPVINPVPFYGISTTTTPIITSWIHAINQPLKNRIRGRQQPPATEVPPVVGSQAPYLSYWKQPVNQPIRGSVRKRQQPRQATEPFYGITVAIAPVVTSWAHLTNQPLKGRIARRQQPISKHISFYALPVTVPSNISELSMLGVG